MNDQNLNENNINENEIKDNETSAANPFVPALDLTSDPKYAQMSNSAAENAPEQTTASHEPIFECGPEPAQVTDLGGASENSSGGYVPPHEPPKYTPPEPPRYNPPETVYIGVPEQKPKPPKAPKARLSVGAAIILVAVCVVLSCAASFGGTLLANRFIKNNPNLKPASVSSHAQPSVIFRDLEERNEEPGTYTQVAEKVSPAVVEIITESLVTDSYFWGSYVTSGAGSGVIVSADGMIITNNHVVSSARNIRVRLSDGSEHTAVLIGTDADTDIAVIKIEAENLPFAILGNSDELHVGEEILAVGNPLGQLGGTVTNGIVSAISRSITIDGTEMTLIQMNAAVNPGNSGGGLFNLYGELIGIVNAKTTSSSSGISVEGIGFAIPINTVSKVVEELVNYGYVRGKAMLGINYVDITSDYEAFVSGYRNFGVYVTASSQPDLKAGDRIVAIDGEEVMYSQDIKTILTDKSVGDNVEVTVVRNGKYVTVDISLLERKPENAGETDADDSYNTDGREDRYDDGDDGDRDDAVADDEYHDDDRDAFSKFFEDSFGNWFW